MNETPRPQLVLSQPPESLRPKPGGVPRAWLWAIAAMNLAALACLVALLTRSASAPAGGGPATGANVEELRSVAVELEGKSLDLEAARAWQAYLDAEPKEPQRAEITYRIGKLYMQAEKYGDAAAALVRAEKTASSDPELSRKIGTALVECLRRLGRYGEMGRELSRRVEVGGEKAAQPRVLATIAGESFTEADLDRLVERRVDGILAMQPGGVDPRRREAILKQMSTAEARRQLLQELVQTELFCRRARETGLDREESFTQARDQLEQGLLAGRFISRELERIQPTDVDLQSYFKANTARYEQPESLDALVIQLQKEDSPEELLAKISSADDFRKLAAQRSGGKDEQQAPPPMRRVVRKQDDPTLGNVEPLFELAEGQWTKTPLANGEHRYLVLVDKKNPAQTPSFEQAAQRVRADYTAVKQRELTDKLLQDLTSRYQVRIMPAGEAPKQPDKNQAENKQPEKKP